MSAVAEQAVAALRVAVGDALDAFTPPVPLHPAGFKPATTDNVPWWVEESPADGTSERAECGPPSASAHYDRTEVVQYMLRGPRDSGWHAFRARAEVIEAAVMDQLLTLTDGVTPVIVHRAMIGGLRENSDFGRDSMPVVVFYQTIAPRDV